MKRFLYIVYGLFAAGAVRKFWKDVGKHREFKVMCNRYDMRSSWFNVKLVYVRDTLIGSSRIDGGNVKLRHYIVSGYFRRFRCRGASSNVDVMCELRKAMDIYIKRHGGLAKGIDYSLAPMPAYVGGVEYRGNKGLEDFDLVKEAFYGIPREL